MTDSSLLLPAFTFSGLEEFDCVETLDHNFVHSFAGQFGVDFYRLAGVQADAESIDHVLCVEVQDQVQIAVSIDVFKCEVVGGDSGELHRAAVDYRRVEVGRCVNRDWDDSLALRIDLVLRVAGFNIDVDGLDQLDLMCDLAAGAAVFVGRRHELATFAPDGELIDSSNSKLDESLAVVVEREDGRQETMTPSGFRKFREIREQATQSE